MRPCRDGGLRRPSLRRVSANDLDVPLIDGAIIQKRQLTNYAYRQPTGTLEPMVYLQLERQDSSRLPAVPARYANSIIDSLARTRIQPRSARLRIALATASFFSGLFQVFFQSRM